MSSPLLEALRAQPELLGTLGRRLLDIGTEMVAGRLDDALADMLSRSEPPTWYELDQAIITIQREARRQELQPELEEAFKALLLAIASGLAVELGALLLARVGGTAAQ